MTRRVGIDFETYCDLDLADVGVDSYSRHPSCEILMCAYAFDKAPVRQWVPVEGEPIPADLEDALLDERVIKTAWNKSFEATIWRNTYGLSIPHEQWRCTQALAYSLALPGSLGKAGEVVEITEDQKKSTEGRALMRVFSQPRKPSKHKPWTRTYWWMEPEKWQSYLAYNRLDVEAERAILRKLLPFDMPEHEWALWVVDQKINERGIPINMAVVDKAIVLYETLVGDGMKQMRQITGLANPNSTQQLLPWLQDRGYRFDDLKKGHVERAAVPFEEAREAGDILPPRDADLADVLLLRVDTARASPKKYYALDRCVDRAAGVLRNAFQFAGAGRTWRWAGRMFQAQNLPRPMKQFEKIMEMVVEHLERLDTEAINLIYDNPMGLLVSCIRSMAQAPDGYLLYDSDLNAIENRVLGWIARDMKILRVFELKRDPYIDFATYMFHEPYDALFAEYTAGYGAKRQISKPAVLGCGYQLGPGAETVNHKTGEIEATGLLGYARNMNVKMTPEQAKLSVEVFRATYEEVVDSWRGLERAAKRCIRTGLDSEFNMIRFVMKAPFMLMILPSGRSLHYCRPRLEPVRAPWGEVRETITYEGLNDRNQWVRISSHGGKIMENADQAIARDLLAHGMMLADQRGLDLCLHVHDQIVGVAPIAVAEDHLAILQECMAEPPKWGRYRGVDLPLASSGFVSKIFMKD